MAKFTGEISGSLAFKQGGVVQTQMVPGLNSLALTGSLNITGSQLTLNGRNILLEIDALSAGSDPDIGTLRLHSGSMLIYTGSNDARVQRIENLTGSIHQLNASTSSYFLKSDSANVVSSSNQIIELGFNRDVISGSQQIIDLGFNKNVISGSRQIQDLGFVTSSNIADYDDLYNVPSGILSSSIQLTTLGFITGSSFFELDNIPVDLVSSSAQIQSFLFGTTTNFGTGVVSASKFSGDGSGLTNISVGQVTSIKEDFDNASSVTVNHNFNSPNVNVAVYDSNGFQLLPSSVQLTDNNTAVVTFDSNTSGYAVASLGGHIFSGSSAWENLTNVPSGIISSSAQISALGFGAGGSGTPSGTVSSSAQIIELGFITGSTYQDLVNIPANIISSSAQIANLGFGGGNIAPSGTISSSAQILDLGFVTGSDFNTTLNIPDGLISSSLQIAALGYLTSSHSDVNGLNAKTGSYATTGSNSFVGTQTITGNVIPGVSTNDLGSQAAPWQHLYISSGSIKFVNPDGTVLSSFNNQFDGNRIISNTEHPLFNSFNPGSSTTIEDFLNAVFYPNTAPTISTGNQTIAEYTANGTSIVTLAGSDAESQAITFSIDDSYTDGYVIVDNGVLKLNVLPTATAFNTDNRGDGTLAHPVIVKATDTVGASSTKTIYIRVTPNEAPVFRHPNVGSNAISSYSVSRNENASAGEVTKIYFTDAEGDNITINSGSDLNGHFSISKSSNYVTITQVTASLDYENITQYNMSITASDSHYEDGDDADSFIAIPITINVTDNTQPTVNDQTLTGVNENSSDGASAGTITATDPEGDTVTFKSARFHSQQLDGVNVPTGSYGGTSQSDPTEDAFSISSTGTVTRKVGVYLNSDLVNKAIYEVTVTDPYNNGSDKGYISIPIVDDTAPTISGDTTLYVIESATSGHAIYDNSNGFSGTTSRFTANQTVTWAVSSSNDFAISSTGYLTLARDISGSADVGGDQLSGIVTATNTFGTSATQAFTVNITDNVAPTITFTNTSANLNTNKAIPGNNLVTMTFADLVNSDAVDLNSFSASFGGHDLTIVESGASRIVRANSNLAAGTYNVTASIADVEGFETRTSSHAFTIAQAVVGTLTTNGTFYIIESAENGALIRTNSNGRTGTQADLEVSYSPNYGGQAVQAYTSSNAAIVVASDGNLSLGLDISGSATGSGDTITSNITFQDQYGNVGSGSITVNVVTNQAPSVTVSEQSGLETDTISGSLVATISVSDAESDYPITLALSGTDASSFTATSNNGDGTSWNIVANTALSAGTYNFTATATDAFGKTGTDTATITVEQSADYGLVYVYTSTYGSDAGFAANYLGVMGGATVNSDTPPEVTSYTANTLSPYYKFKAGDVGSSTISLAGGATATLRASGSGAGLDQVLSSIGSISAAETGQVIIVYPSGSDMTVPTSVQESFNSTAGGAVPAMNVDGNGYGIESGVIHSLVLDSAHLGYSEWFVFGRKSQNAIASSFNIRLVNASGSLPS